ncbi:MAG: amino-acid N-acetyltransferase [Pseudomonadota bacterium]
MLRRPMDIAQYAQWFRNSTPYIKAHRGRTFVLHLPGEALEPPHLVNLVHDLALLHSLGAHLILVHGARPQLDSRLPDSQIHAGRRITGYDDLPLLQRICGELKGRLEAAFSTGLPNTPLHGTEITVASGNLVTARPLGVINGIDHLYSGAVRRVRGPAIRALLDTGAIVLLSPLGYSPSGQAFNLPSEELAALTAAAVQADKLIQLQPDAQLENSDGTSVSQLHPDDLETLIEDTAQPFSHRRRLQAAREALRRGVPSVQFVSFRDDGALLAELYTAGGQGTQITAHALARIRQARPKDLAAIVELIRPLEDEGVLVRRGRDRLEAEMTQFFVAELDGIVVGCAALYPFDNAASAELACVATHAAYRQQGYRIGQRLLSHAETLAQQQGLTQLFVLTTQAQDWFTERGFERMNPTCLPESKQALYNYQRNSTVLAKTLSPTEQDA